MTITRRLNEWLKRLKLKVLVHQRDAVLTVKHILLDCPELWDVRLKYVTASSLKDIFESVDNQTVIDFIKDANFYHQL